jgi:uridine kinase
MPEKIIPRPYIIGVAGGSGSGKTFFLNSFLKNFAPNQIAVISQDDYYIPANTKTKEENKIYNFDLPTSFYRENFHQDILALISGETIHRQEYTFNNPVLQSKTLKINPAPILLIEGLFILHYTEINKLLDHRIFIHADEEVALKRRIERDWVERGYNEEDVMYKWINHVMPAFNEYLLPYKKQCDQIIVNNSNDTENISAIAKDIAAYLRMSFFNT